MKSINEIRKVKCVDFTFDGQGLAKDENNRVIFVPSLLIDEEAEVEILYKKKRGLALFIIGSNRIFVRFDIFPIEFEYFGKGGGR